MTPLRIRRRARRALSVLSRLAFDSITERILDLPDTADHRDEAEPFEYRTDKRGVHPAHGTVGKLDELVVRGASFVHLEQMDDRTWLLSVTEATHPLLPATIHRVTLHGIVAVGAFAERDPGVRVTMADLKEVDWGARPSPLYGPGGDAPDWSLLQVLPREPMPGIDHMFSRQPSPRLDLGNLAAPTLTVMRLGAEGDSFERLRTQATVDVRVHLQDGSVVDMSAAKGDGWPAGDYSPIEGVDPDRPELDAAVVSGVQWGKGGIAPPEDDDEPA